MAEKEESFATQRYSASQGMFQPKPPVYTSNQSAYFLHRVAYLESTTTTEEDKHSKSLLPNSYLEPSAGDSVKYHNDRGSPHAIL